MQTMTDYEIVIKDACSNDGSLNQIIDNSEFDPIRDKLRIVIEADKGIYDGMNRALELVNGRFIIFLNLFSYFIVLFKF